jgi:hypothetical protein
MNIKMQVINRFIAKDIELQYKFIALNIVYKLQFKITYIEQRFTKKMDN